MGATCPRGLNFFQNINYWLLTSFFKANWHYKLFSTFCLNYTQVGGQFRGYQCGTSYNKNNWSLSLVDVSLLLTVFTFVIMSWHDLQDKWRLTNWITLVTIAVQNYKLYIQYDMLIMTIIVNLAFQSFKFIHSNIMIHFGIAFI